MNFFKKKNLAKIIIIKIILISYITKLYTNSINTNFIYIFIKKNYSNNIIKKNKKKEDKIITQNTYQYFNKCKKKNNKKYKKRKIKKIYSINFKCIKIKKKNIKKSNKKKYKLKKKIEKIIIMLDPGHGGEDPGAIGKNKTLEKNIVLQIANRLKFLINKNNKMKAYMTRNKDTFISLDNRIKKTKKKKADLFISIHTNSFKDRKINGSSIFVLPKIKEEKIKFYINKIKNKKNTKKTNKKYIKNKITNESLKFGLEVLKKIKKINNLHHNKINQAEFAVLKSNNIPSILIETAFISNPEEEKKLKTILFQKKIANSIFYAIKIYFKK